MSPQSNGGEPQPYQGPPSAQPPPAGWRPPVHMEPLPPRRLVAQDDAALDAGEKDARTLTYGVGLIAGAVFLVVTCLLCSRVLF